MGLSLSLAGCATLPTSTQNSTAAAPAPLERPVPLEMPVPPDGKAVMVRTATGLCWAALTNTRTEPSNDINSALDQMMWQMAHSVPDWGA